jgi:hypothetical protein
MDDGDDVETLHDYRIETPAGRLVHVRVMDVPASTKFPEGVKYRMHYGTLDGDTILRYDNSHGIHERHADDQVEQIAFPGLEELHARFRREVMARE